MLPTRLLLDETVPTVPPVPFIQVTAPNAFAVVPPSPHRVDFTTKFPLDKFVIPLFPTESPAVLPTRLLLAETVPTVPPVPFIQVTAPLALAAMRPSPHLEETTT